MAKNITVQPNQSVLDVVLTQYGSMEAAMQFCLQNGIALSDLPDAGTQYAQPAIGGSIEAEADNKYLQSNGIVIGTAGDGLCGKVTGISVTDITATTAIAHFTAGEGATAMEWYISYGSLQDHGTIIAADATTVMLTGLLPHRAIKFFIRTICAGSKSPWMIKSFVTPELLPSELRILLRPVMMHVSKDVGLISDYVLNYTPDPDFYNFYDLQTDWPESTTLRRTTLEAVEADETGFPREIIPLSILSGNMASKYVQFAQHTEYIAGSIFIWFPNTTGFPDDMSPTFIDVEGNKAICAPVMVNDTGFGDFYTMQGTMEFGEGHVSGAEFIQPVTIGHVGDNPFLHLHGMKLISIDMETDEQTLITYPIPGDTVNVPFHSGRYQLILLASYGTPTIEVTSIVSANAVALEVLEL